MSRNAKLGAIAFPALAVLALACGTGSTPATVPAVADGQTPATTTSATSPGTVGDGIWTVGDDIPAGTYKVVNNITADTNCYWAITKTGTNSRDIIANGVPSGGRPSVTLKKGQDFETAGCGTWAKK